MPRDLITLDNVYENNIGTVSKLSQVVNSRDDSVVYDDAFFKSFLTSGNGGNNTSFSQLAYYSEIPVGAVKAKLCPKKKSDFLLKGLQIELFVVLEPYRGKGVETKLLKYVSEECTKNHQHNLFVYLPVSDTDQIQWFMDNGFEKHPETEPGFLTTKAGPADAVLLKKHLE